MAVGPSGLAGGSCRLIVLSRRSSVLVGGSGLLTSLGEKESDSMNNVRHRRTRFTEVMAPMTAASMAATKVLDTPPQRTAADHERGPHMQWQDLAHVVSAGPSEPSGFPSFSRGCGYRQAR